MPRLSDDTRAIVGNKCGTTMLNIEPAATIPSARLIKSGYATAIMLNLQFPFVLFLIRIDAKNEET
jgi:hypothetical protein